MDKETEAAGSSPRQGCPHLGRSGPKGETTYRPGFYLTWGESLNGQVFFIKGCELWLARHKHREGERENGFALQMSLPLMTVPVSWLMSKIPRHFFLGTHFPLELDALPQGTP